MRRNKVICLARCNFLVSSLTIMATGTRSRVVNAMASLGDDGVIVAPDDYNKFEMIIGDYFNDSQYNSDKSRSEEEIDCGKLHNSS